MIRIKHKYFLLPRSCNLLYHNKICDIISVIMLSTFASGTSMPENSVDLVISFIKHLVQLMIQHKSTFFKIINTLEGLGIGETLLETEEWLNNEFLEAIARHISSSTGFDYFSSELRTLLLSADVPMRHELICLGKILGHPFVSMVGGTMTLHKAVSEPLTINMSKVYRCTDYFKRDYIKKHIHKFRKWPPCQLTSVHAPKALTYSFITNQDPDSLDVASKYGSLNISSYVYVDLLPNMQFHKLENIIPHLKDKTISVLRSKVMAKYIDNVDIESNWRETRLLLAYLIMPTILHDHTKYLDKYTYTDDLESLMEYLVTRIVPKEKELKIDYRGFGCKTYEDRHRSLAQEKNVMMFLDEFSDEQSMTISELSILRRIDSLRRIQQA